MPNEDSTLTEEAKVLICELEAIWDDVGESDSDRVQMLNELREEHIDVCKRELDQAIQRKIDLKQQIAAFRAELDVHYSAMGEQAIDIGQADGTLKDELAALVTLVEKMREMKTQRIHELLELSNSVLALRRINDLSPKDKEWYQNIASILDKCEQGQSGDNLLCLDFIKYSENKVAQFKKDGITNWTASDLKDQIESLIKELKELQGEEKEIGKTLDELYEFLIKNITLLLSFVAAFVATLRMYNGVTCGSTIAAALLLVLSVILLFSPVRLSKEKYEDAQVKVRNHNKKKSTLVESSDVITKAFVKLENETFKGHGNLCSEEELEEVQKSIKIIYSTKVNVNLLQILTTQFRSPTILSRWYQRGMSANSIVALILAIGIAIFICVDAC